MSLLSQAQTYAAPVARVLLSLIFIMSGAQKIGGYSGTQQYMEMMGVSGSLLPLVILVELGAGLALLVGFRARLAAFVLAGFSLVSGAIFHLVPSFAMEGFEAQMQMINFWKNVTISGGLLMVVAAGAGILSFDKNASAVTA